MRSNIVRFFFPPSSSPGFGRNSRAHSIGVVVREMTSEIKMAIESVNANSRKKRPGMPPMNRIGVNTAMSDRLIENTVKPTSRAPSITASRRGMPASKCRDTFSTTTTASSTTKPVAMVKAISERMSRLKPARYMTVNEPTIETGTAMLGMIVARMSRRKKYTTMITSNTAITSVVSVSSNDARMVSDLSPAIFTFKPAGIAASMRGNSALTRSTVSMILAPGCVKGITATAWSSSKYPSLRRSSTESRTVATSLKRTASPLR